MKVYILTRKQVFYSNHDAYLTQGLYNLSKYYDTITALRIAISLSYTKNRRQNTRYDVIN